MQILSGPRGLKIWVSNRKRHLYARHCVHVLSTIEHALRFSNIIATRDYSDYQELLIGYRLERILFVLRRPHGFPTWTLSFIYSALLDPGKFGYMDTAYRKFYRERQSDPARVKEYFETQRVKRLKQLRNTFRNAAREAKYLLSTKAVQIMHKSCEVYRARTTSALARLPGQIPRDLLNDVLTLTASSAAVQAC